MSEAVNGSAGIPREGRTVEYATELWLDGPSAFWLHPEGPLSDTTPEEWRDKQSKKRAAAIDAQTRGTMYLGQIAQQTAFAGLMNAQAGRPLLQHGYPYSNDLVGLSNYGGLFGGLL